MQDIVLVVVQDNSLVVVQRIGEPVRLIPPLHDLVPHEPLQSLLNGPGQVLEYQRSPGAQVLQQTQQKRGMTRQLGERDPSLRVIQQDGGRQGGRRYGRHLVDRVADTEGQILDHPATPDPIHAGEIGLFCLKILPDGQGLCKLDVDPPVFLLQEPPRLQEAQEPLLLLASPAQFLCVARLFDDFLVRNRYGDQLEVFRNPLPKGIQFHRQHAQLRLQQLARPTSRSLEEEFLNMSLPQQLPQVGAENGCIQLLAPDRPADEEGPCPSEDVTQRPERQVHTGRNVRGRQVVLIEDIRQDKIVDMALVAGHEDDRALSDRRLDPFQPLHVHREPAVDVVPNP